MTRSVYYTATTLDGFIADEHDSLAWLFEQQTDEGGPAGYEEFIAGVGAMVMGATTSGSWQVRCASTTQRSPRRPVTATSGWWVGATWPVSSPISACSTR
jgi:dihydrofolate reductase